MPGSKPYYVYVMTNRFHTTVFMGMTPDLERRVLMHKLGATTSFHHPGSATKLIYYEALRFAYQAIQRERHLRTLPKRLLFSLVASHNPLWRDLAQDLDLMGAALGRGEEEGRGRGK